MRYYELPGGERVDSITETLRGENATTKDTRHMALSSRACTRWAIYEAVHGNPAPLDEIRRMIRAHDDEGNNEQPEGGQ